MQIRGSIPLYWSQPETWKLKPNIVISEYGSGSLQAGSTLLAKDTDDEGVDDEVEDKRRRHQAALAKHLRGLNYLYGYSGTHAPSLVHRTDGDDSGPQGESDGSPP